jgi:hypothetical protein
MVRLGVKHPSGHGAIVSSVASSRLALGIVLTTMTGRVTESVCEERLPEFQRLMGQASGATWVLDLVGMSGFEPKAVLQGSRWFAVFAEARGTSIILVSQNSTARMAAQALAFGAGVNLRCFTSLSEAQAQLKLIF